MTQREFLITVKDTSANEELISYAERELEKLNQRAATRSSKPSKKQLENEPLKEKILELFNNLPDDSPGNLCAAEVCEALEVSVQKASSMLQQLTAAEKLEVTERRVKGKGAVKFYKMI